MKIKNLIIKSFYLLLVISLISGCKSDEKSNSLEVNQTKLEFRKLGKEKPTIIFENGMGSKIETWKTIPDSISKTSQVFLYNRAGVGNSKLSERKRTIPNMVEELRTLLKNENIEPPYIYVAHSMGSYLARYFASNYPNEVKAVLLVDPSPNKMYDEYSEKEFNDFKKIGDDSFSKAGEGEKLEWKNYLENRKYVRNLKISNDIPIVIVSATQWDFSKYHKEMLNENTFSKHIIEEGGHDIHQEKPEFIINLIEELIAIEN